MARLEVVQPRTVDSMMCGWGFAEGEVLEMGIDDELIGEIMRRILRIARPVRVILFGSAAAGRMTPDSDIDLLVVEAAPGDTRMRSVAIGDSLDGLDYPVDVIVMAADRFEETREVVGGIAYPANKYGKVIYEAA